MLFETFWEAAREGRLHFFVHKEIEARRLGKIQNLFCSFHRLALLDFRKEKEVRRWLGIKNK